MQIYWLTIQEIINETDEVTTYLLEWPKEFGAWQEGAHTHMALKGFDRDFATSGQRNRRLIRHMSISTLPRERTIGITTRIKKNRSPYKDELEKHQIGDKVAFFKTRSNIPLKREDKSVYLLSAGVGLATFRPLLLRYLADIEGIPKVCSLNIDSTRKFLFQDIFITDPKTRVVAHYVDNRDEYYQKLEALASQDKEGLYYVVGSDEFIQDNINHLLEKGISPQAIMIDKKEAKRADFLPL